MSVPTAGLPSSCDPSFSERVCPPHIWASTETQNLPVSAGKTFHPWVWIYRHVCDHLGGTAVASARDSDVGRKPRSLQATSPHTAAGQKRGPNPQRGCLCPREVGVAPLAPGWSPGTLQALVNRSPALCMVGGAGLGRQDLDFNSGSPLAPAVGTSPNFSEAITGRQCYLSSRVHVTIRLLIGRNSSHQSTGLLCRGLVPCPSPRAACLPHRENQAQGRVRVANYTC